MNLDTLSSAFRRDGYVHLPGFYPDDLMGHLDGLIRAHFRASPEYRHSVEFLAESRTEVIPWFPEREGSKAFHAIRAEQRLRDLTTTLIGEGWRDDYSMVMYSPPGTTGQAWHQDCDPADPRAFNLNRLVYTRAIEESVGGELAVVPGSHRRGLLPPGDPHESLPGERIIRPGRGDLILLHGHSWHRVLPIRGGDRSSTNFRAASREAPADVTDVCVYRNMRYRFSTETTIERR